MRNIHIIIDLYYMYYRYKYVIESGRIRPLNIKLDDASNIDLRYIYYTIKSIEGELAKFKDDRVTTSICIDSYSDRKELSGEYKSNRVGKLQPFDHFNIDFIESILRQVGYNVYKEYGSEADDLIAGLVAKYHNDYDMTYIFTPDADILVNLKKDVNVYRFKTSIKGHILVTPDNFEELMSAEYKCRMPYNCISLYKCLCGDKSDGIPGIKGFGAKTFNKLISSLEKDNFDFRLLSSYKNVETALYMKEKFITCGDKSKFQEALDSLSLIKSKDTIITNDRPIYNTNLQQNKELVYGERYKFVSLV